ncbi:MAG TPA: HtaA domain-containing protein [Caulobacteraceae bacterium]
MAATLNWGVKESFRNYVEGSGGAIDAGLGAARTEDGGFTFPAAPGQGLTLGADGRPQGRGEFTGEVRFQAHGGMLSVFLADPALEIAPSGAFLTVADSPDRTRRLPLAKLDLAAMSTADDGELVIPASMSNEGWQVLGDHYLPSTPLDPVRVRLTGA